MKMFSPAGMANKGFYGGPGWPQGGDPAGGGRSGWGSGSLSGGYAFANFGTFGNPDGATIGGGAWSQAGNNPNGPNQGGGGPPPTPPLVFTQTNGLNSTGPLQFSGYSGDGSGFYKPVVALNGGFGSGTTVPDPVDFAAGSPIEVSGWGANAPYGGGFFCVCVQGTFLQNAFTKINLGAPANLTFTTATANDYSTVKFPGFTIWTWSDTHEFAFFPPLTVTLTY